MSRKKKGKPEKPRTIAVQMNMGKPVAISGVQMNANGTFEMLGADGVPIRPVSAFVERAYDRPKGPKVLSRTPVDPTGPMHYDVHLAVVKFDVIYIIDANSRHIRGENVSVAVLVLGRWASRGKGEAVLNFAPMYALEYRDANVHPDLLALHYAVLGLQASRPQDSDLKVGLVIDSHLGELERIRSRAAPVLNDVFLPEWADIIYATDAAMDSVVNLLLRRADRESTKLLDALEAEKMPDHPWRSDTASGARFRMWNSPAARPSAK